MIEERESEQLDAAIKSFTAKTILLLHKVKKPSFNMKNIILAFLTVFHEELDNLIEESIVEEAQYDRITSG